MSMLVPTFIFLCLSLSLSLSLSLPLSLSLSLSHTHSLSHLHAWHGVHTAYMSDDVPCAAHFDPASFVY